MLKVCLKHGMLNNGNGWKVAISESQKKLDSRGFLVKEVECPKCAKEQCKKCLKKRRNEK